VKNKTDAEKLSKALSKIPVRYRISTPSPSLTFPWEAYWPGRSVAGSPDEELRYFETLVEAQEWILKKHRQSKKRG
jgi:hypothetical protein